MLLSPLTASAHVLSTLRRLKASRLRRNPSMTQVMWLGSAQQLVKVPLSEIPVLSSPICVAATARNLGVVFDNQLSMSAHVTAVYRSGYYQLRQLRPLRRCMTTDACVHRESIGLLQRTILRNS